MRGRSARRDCCFAIAWGNPQQTAGSNVVEVLCATCAQKLEGGRRTAADPHLARRGYCPSVTPAASGAMTMTLAARLALAVTGLPPASGLGLVGSGDVQSASSVEVGSDPLGKRDPGATPSFLPIEAP